MVLIIYQQGYLNILIVFLLGVGMNFKPLLKTLTCVSVMHVLDKFMTLE